MPPRRWLVDWLREEASLSLYFEIEVFILVGDGQSNRCPRRAGRVGAFPQTPEHASDALASHCLIPFGHRHMNLTY
jgi:hypothetical protein